MDLEAMTDDELLNEAKKQGYNPDYDGENKKSPREYLEISFNHNKMLKERNEHLSYQNDELENQVRDLNQKVERVLQFAEEQKIKAVNNAIQKLQEEKREAISDGDTELVEKIDQRIEAEKNVAKSDSNPILDEWIKNNPWYLKDDELGTEADIIAKQLQDTGRFAPTDQDYQRLLDAVEKRVKTRFADRFKNPKKDNPPDVESARQSPANSSKKTYANLPPDAKKACDEFVRDNIMSREKYLELYEWD